MIQLSRHIEILLLDNDCVIVPGLGGFTAHYIEARIDENDKIFLPPQRTLGFNPQLKLNDSLLVQSYIEAYSLSYPEALRLIENEVEELKQHLNNKGFYELDDIGILTYNGNGSYLFEPCEAGLLTPELYGLSSFELTRYNNNIIETDQNVTVTNLALSDNIASLGEETYNSKTNENVISIKVSWIRNIAVAAAAIILFFLIATPISNGRHDAITLCEIGSFALTGITPDNVSMETNSFEFAKSAPHTDTVNYKKEITIQADTIQCQLKQECQQEYCIVMASRITKKNAESFVSELQHKGYKDAYVYINNGIVRVAYGEYNSLNEAYNDLAKIKAVKKYEHSWVYKKQQ